MDALTDFIIPIIGLKLGEHSYQFKVDRQFFKEFDNTDLQEGCLQVDLNFKKKIKSYGVNVSSKRKC